VVVVVGQVLGRVLLFIVVVVVIVVTYCGAAVVVIVVVRGKVMIHIRTRFLGLILNPGQTQGYV